MIFETYTIIELIELYRLWNYLCLSTNDMIHDECKLYIRNMIMNTINNDESLKNLFSDFCICPDSYQGIENQNCIINQASLEYKCVYLYFLWKYRQT